MGKKAQFKLACKMMKGCAIPSRPSVMLEVIKTQNTFAPDARQVTAVIRRDMALASAVLRAANTCLPQHKRAIASIDQAVILLGPEPIGRIVQHLFLSAGLTGKDSLMQRVRRQAIEAGQVTQWLARELPETLPAFKNGLLKPADPDEALVVGLFHDCGQAMLIQKFSDYAAFLDQVYKEGRQTVVEAENERYRTNHCLLGFLLADSWCLPVPIAQLIRDHHQVAGFANPDKKAQKNGMAPLHALLYLAQYICGKLPRKEWEVGREPLLAYYGIDNADLERLQKRALEAVRSPKQAA